MTTNAASGAAGNIKFAVPLGDVVDLEKEKQRITGQLTQQKKAADNLSKRLQNENFVSKAPQDVVDKEKNRLKELEANISALEEVYQNLS